MLFCSSLCFVALHKLRFSFLKQRTNYLAPVPGHQDLPFLAFHNFFLLGLSEKKEQASTDLPWLVFCFILHVRDHLKGLDRSEGHETSKEF